MFDVETKWLFGLVDVYGYERKHVLPGAVLGTLAVDGRPTWRRIDAGDHEAALGIELGMRANSWLEDVCCPVCGDTPDFCPMTRDHRLGSR